MQGSEAISETMPIAKRKQTSSAKGRGKGKVKKLSTMLKKINGEEGEAMNSQEESEEKLRTNCSR